MSDHTIQQIPLDAIVIDSRLQMREEEIDWAFAETLKESLLEDDTLQMTPIILFVDEGGSYYPGDGHHRIHGHLMAERKTIAAIVHEGGYEAAFKHALGANANQNAKPRTRADIRKAVIAAIKELILGRPKAEAITQQEVAELCKCNQATVSRIYKELTGKTKKTKTKPEESEQLTFFDALNEDFAVIPETFADILGRPYWIDEKYPVKERLDGIIGLRTELARMLAAAKQHEQRLRGQQTAK